MKSLLAEVADSQFAACQIVTAIARSAPDTRLPVSALSQALFLNEAEMRDFYGDTVTAVDVVAYVRHAPATHLLTHVYDEGVQANG